MKKNLVIDISLLAIICILLVWNFSNNISSLMGSHASKKVTVAKATVTQHPVASPTTLPSPTGMPTSDPTTATIYHPAPTAVPTVENYQNYGWYTHDGQSMQYVNGNWYSSAQQNATPTPPNPTMHLCSHSYSMGGTFGSTTVLCDGVHSW